MYQDNLLAISKVCATLDLRAMGLKPMLTLEITKKESNNNK